jgi:hypothetical protein
VGRQDVRWIDLTWDMICLLAFFKYGDDLLDSVKACNILAD